MVYHTLPQLEAPDAVFSLGVIEITVRQLLCCILGGLLSVNVWSRLTPFMPSTLLHWGFTLLPLLLAWLFGWLHLQGRPLEVWIVVLFRFLSAPRILLWRPTVVPLQAQTPPHGQPMLQAFFSYGTRRRPSRRKRGAK